jgi:hypothetical protein
VEVRCGFCEKERRLAGRDAEPKTLERFGFRSLGQSPKLPRLKNGKDAIFERRKPKAFARARD